MTFLLATDEDQRNALDILYHQPIGQVEPGILSGSLSAPFRGIGSGATAFAGQAAGESLRFLETAISGVPEGSEERPPNFGDIVAQQTEENTRKIATTMKPDPATTGSVGQVLFSVTDVLSRFGLGAAATGNIYGGAVTSGFSVGQQTSEELKAAGVDPASAEAAGEVQGAFAGAGALLPAALPGRIATRLLTGSGINIASGAADRYAMHKVLEAYPEQAKQYQWLDAKAMATDAILGAAFGYFAPFHAEERPDVTLAEKDAAMTANNALHIEESAPGVPADIPSRDAHVEAVDTATRQLLNDEPVNVEPIVADKHFVERPVADETHVMEEALRRSGYDDIIAEIHDLEKELEARGRQSAEAVLPEFRDIREPAARRPIEPSPIIEGGGPDIQVSGTEPGRTDINAEVAGQGNGEVAPVRTDVTKQPDALIASDAGIQKRIDIEQKAEAEQKDASQMQKGFEAAINCFKENG